MSEESIGIGMEILDLNCVENMFLKGMKMTTKTQTSSNANISKTKTKNINAKNKNKTNISSLPSLK